MPVFATSPSGDVHHLFVVDRAGLLRIVRDDVLLARPFLDIHGIVNSGYLERGLLGLAFSPQYATDKSFYVCYTALNGDVTVARYKTTAADPESADASSGQTILTASHSVYQNHNGGMIAFAPDGYLYVGVGDGGNEGDPNGTGQDPSDFLGSILRIDVSGGGVGHTSPPDNPFPSASQPSGLQEIWAFGLRNPWRFSFDRANGDLYIGDVGQDTYEEVDVATAASGRGKGLNYGWSKMEGSNCFSPSSGCNTTGLTLPTISYQHTSSQDCVVGGYVYRGLAMPGLAGTYFYSDYQGAWLKSFQFSGGVATNGKDWGVQLAPSGVGVTSFGEDAHGEIYVCCTNGAVKRIGP